eukprot:1160671-Pelagomonas_calceolata.AAC.3
MSADLINVSFQLTMAADLVVEDMWCAAAASAKALRNMAKCWLYAAAAGQIKWARLIQRLKSFAQEYKGRRAVQQRPSIAHLHATVAGRPGVHLLPFILDRWLYKTRVTLWNRFCPAAMEGNERPYDECSKLPKACAWCCNAGGLSNRGPLLRTRHASAASRPAVQLPPPSLFFSYIMCHHTLAWCCDAGGLSD